MKSGLSSSNDMPPAVEIARAIGATPVRVTGTALIRWARSADDNDDSETPVALAASCSNPIATGDRCAALRRKFDRDCLPFGADNRAIRSFISISGRKIVWRVAFPEP